MIYHNDPVYKMTPNVPNWRTIWQRAAWPRSARPVALDRVAAAAAVLWFHLSPSCGQIKSSPNQAPRLNFKPSPLLLMHIAKVAVFVLFLYVFFLESVLSFFFFFFLRTIILVNSTLCCVFFTFNQSSRDEPTCRAHASISLALALA